MEYHEISLEVTSSKYDRNFLDNTEISFDETGLPGTRYISKNVKRFCRKSLGQQGRPECSLILHRAAACHR
jgi:hypothetical protein